MRALTTVLLGSPYTGFFILHKEIRATLKSSRTQRREWGIEQNGALLVVVGVLRALWVEWLQSVSSRTHCLLSTQRAVCWFTRVHRIQNHSSSNSKRHFGCSLYLLEQGPLAKSYKRPQANGDVNTTHVHSRSSRAHIVLCVRHERPNRMRGSARP